jgi:hypothetical protein
MAWGCVQTGCKNASNRRLRGYYLCQSMLVCATITLAPLLVAVAAQNSRRTARTDGGDWPVLAVFEGRTGRVEGGRYFIMGSWLQGGRLNWRLVVLGQRACKVPAAPIKGWFARDSFSCFQSQTFLLYSWVSLLLQKRLPYTK